MSELFELPPSLSPRLAWLNRNNLVVRQKPSGTYCCGLDDENIGKGETEDEAIIDFCLKTKLPHYSQP